MVYSGTIDSPAASGTYVEEERPHQTFDIEATNREARRRRYIMIVADVPGVLY